LKKGNCPLKLQIGIDGKSFEVEVEVLEEDAAQPQLRPQPSRQPAASAQPAPAAKAQAPAVAEDVVEAKVCRSPVNGIVIKVNVAPGQAVQANDLLLVLEAMKMETNVSAHSAGTVKNVRVAPGDSVKVNQVVVEFA
jgi:methylmalonyl-CoA carboxyltransferase small subunit